MVHKVTKLDVESLAKYEHDMGAAQQLIRELRAENKRLLGGWQDAESEIKRLLAEVERLRAEIHRERTEHEIEEKTLEAENERMRAESAPEGHHAWLHFTNAIECWCRRQPPLRQS